MPKIAILVDGSNVYASGRALNFQVDFRKVVTLFEEMGYEVSRLYYFTAVRKTLETDNLKPMLDYLEYNGWTVITKPTKEWTDQETGITNIKGNMDIEMCQVANELAEHVDEMVLFTGDGDFRFMVESLQRWRGMAFTVVSTIASSPPMCADELRRQANSFIDLATIKDKIRRESNGTRNR